MLRGELFSTDMVRAYQDGRKLHTARPIKPQPNAKTFVPSEFVIPECAGAYFFDDGTVTHPKHRPGDYIYCRETWRDVGSIGGHGIYDYKADGCDPKLDRGPLCWRPSIHMPREAARLFFRNKNTTVMRLEDVDEQFAREDGFLPGDCRITGGPYGVEDDPGEWTALDAFKQFWIDTYGPNARWMWVYWTEPCSREEAMGDEEMETSECISTPYCRSGSRCKYFADYHECKRDWLKQPAEEG